jgi:hypothetical protein
MVYSGKPNQLVNNNEKILGDKQSLVFFRAGSSIFKTNRVQIYTQKKRQIHFVSEIMWFGDEIIVTNVFIHQRQIQIVT